MPNDVVDSGGITFTDRYGNIITHDDEEETEELTEN